MFLSEQHTRKFKTFSFMLNGGIIMNDFGEQKMHKAVCAECGQECEVPFKPSGDRPVYCKECYRKRRPSY